MSAVEGTLLEAILEQKSSIKISSNSKGEAVPEVKCYEGVAPDEMDRLRGIAVEQYRALLREVRS
jgi:hypothetical protein